VIEWEMVVGHDDGDERVRLSVLAGPGIASERARAASRREVKSAVPLESRPSGL
jgi:hypothetical protein